MDVGGTFTDCFLRRPDGSIRRHKLLSSGLTLGRAAWGSTRRVIVDPARRADPVDFWRGARLTLRDAQGAVVGETQVVDFDVVLGQLIVDPALDVDPLKTRSYELALGLEAPVLAVRYLLRLGPDQTVPPVAIRLGTTRGTNALLTRRGARTALVTTRGFADVLRIGYQNRPALFARAIRKPQQLAETSVEIDERLAADGSVLIAINAEAVRQTLAPLKSAGVESLAICLLHAVANPVHEQVVASVAEELGFAEISVSHAVSQIPKIVPRGDTTCVDAYLNPVLRSYVASLKKHLPEASLRLMTSAGGLVSAEHFTGKDSLLSGPAGGVVGMGRVAQAAGFGRAIGFDMGGTSTDVSRFDGTFPLDYETHKAGVRVATPMMAIETVAAGGGSICRFDGVKLTVGPESASADPGPACYGRGGPLCVTDLNVFLGRVPEKRFPFPLDLAAVRRRLDALSQQLADAGHPSSKLEELAEGLLRIANANMVEAIRSVSLAKGYDPREHVLVAFGGAANQHACAVAGDLGMSRILNHPDAGLLCALGIGLADVTRHHEHQLAASLTAESAAQLIDAWMQLEKLGRDDVAAEGIANSSIVTRRRVDLRYQGVDAFLTVDAGDLDLTTGADRLAAELAKRYEHEHQRLFGYRQSGRAVELGAARVETVGGTSQAEAKRGDLVPRRAEPRGTTLTFFAGEWIEVPLFDRERLQPGDTFSGPALVAERVSTTVIEPGWQVRVLAQGELLVERDADAESQSKPAAHIDRIDPVMLEVFNNRFSGIAEQMGIVLRQTASSVNVKERLDFSCAVFTAAGMLVVNAPHIPVHLGSMGLAVRATLADNPDLKPGDVFVTNDPYRGGSHLPDVTVITPVFDASGQRLIFFTASRAHHAELGGIRPGSMPPFSKNLAEEGVLIRNVRLLDGGESRVEDLRQLLTTAPYPTRRVDDNIADCLAQVAANQQGVRDLLALVEEYSLETVERAMTAIQEAAAEKLRQVLRQWPNGTRTFVDHLDDGSPIAVRLTILEETLTIDFTGTGPVLSTNLNANRAIVTAAVLYSLRLLLDEPIPLNEGVLAPVEIVLPECLLNPSAGSTPETSPAVVGGNVETSQRIVDCLLGAFGLAAASQGTMNNLTFGDETFGYYETICGGSGATSDSPGADAVQTHMTNTRLTDPEVLERRYPVRLWAFAIRAGSGGVGRMPGGCGVVRRLEFLKPLDVAILSQRRGPYPPYGLEGGEPGALGEQHRIAKDGTREPLAGCVQFRAEAGDQLEIQTPGGGGFGPKD
jgi:5-oxoprolinase (ATP-hydrolysing)